MQVCRFSDWDRWDSEGRWAGQNLYSSKHLVLKTCGMQVSQLLEAKMILLFFQEI